MDELLPRFFGLFLLVGPPCMLIVLGLIVGRKIEQNHFIDLERRESATQHILVSQIRAYSDSAIDRQQAPTMVISEVVISSDYLKSFLGGIQNLFGGEIRGFETLLERARREGILRLKEQAIAMGYNAICCVRIETAEIGGQDPSRRKSIVMASLLVSGTAYYRLRPVVAALA